MASESERPRLLVLASTYPRWAGDTEPGFVHELARRLTSCFAVTVLSPHARGAARCETLDGVEIIRYRYAPVALELLVNNGGIVTNLRRRPILWLLVPGFILMQAWMTWRLVRRLKPAAIHAHWLIPQGLVVASLARWWRKMPPYLVTSHGADLFALRGRAACALKRFVLRGAAAVTVVSEGMREELLRLGVDNSRVTVEPMGVDLANRFHPDAAVKRSRNELLFVGRLVEKKGLHILIEAMPRILHSCPDTILTVAGFGPEEPALRAQVERLNLRPYVRFLGTVPQIDLPSLYRRAALFVAPFLQAASGDQDGLGLVLIEAIGCGCPVVVSRIPATAALLREVRGLVGVPPAEVDVLAAEIVAAIATPPRVDASTVAGFDWEKRAAAYGTLLRRLCRFE